MRLRAHLNDTGRRLADRRPAVPMRRRLVRLAMMAMTAMLAMMALPALPAPASAAPAAAMEAHGSEAFRQSFGLNSHIAGQGAGDPARYARIREALRDIGILYSRGRIGKNNIERARDLYRCCGIRTLARLDTRHGNDVRGALDPDGVEAALDLALAVGGEALAGFEGPNEYTRYHDTGDWHGDLRAYMQRIQGAVRGRGLTQPIVGPTVYMRREAEIRALGDLSRWVDASAFHIYTGGLEPSAQLADYLGDAAIMAPGKPVWVTEYGFHNTVADPAANPVSERAAAKYLPRFATLLFQASPAGKHFLYELVDEGTDPTEREHHFGLLRHDLTPKPAYGAIKRLVEAVGGGTPGLAPQPLVVGIEGGGGAVRALLLQKTERQYLLLLWQEVRSWNRALQADIAVPPRRVAVRVPQAAAFSLTDTLPDSLSAATRDLGGGPAVTIDVPDHIVLLAVTLR